MTKRITASHLPSPPIDLLAYHRLYASGIDSDWDILNLESLREIRIPGRLSPEEVYRRLPSAPDFEYGGYLTKTRIRYMACEPTKAFVPSDSKLCTFHSHPSSHPRADAPSPSDVYQFLKQSHLRAITVGANWIWVWDKPRKVFTKIKQLLVWEEKHLVAEMTRLSKKHPDSFVDRYMVIALRRVGLSWPTRLRNDLPAWSALLRRCLGIKTTLLRRDEGHGR